MINILINYYKNNEPIKAERVDLPSVPQIDSIISNDEGYFKVKGVEFQTDHNDIIIYVERII